MEEYMAPKELQDATKDLVESFPEFKKSEFYGATDSEITYLVFGDFDRFLLDYMMKNLDSISSDDLIKRFCSFVNKLYDSGNNNLRELVLVGMFEYLGQYQISRKLIPCLSKDVGGKLGKFIDGEWSDDKKD